MSKGKG